MTAKITSISDNVGSLGTNKGEAFRFGDDNSGQLASFRNKIINGDFRIWQRAASFSISARWTTMYTADRWLLAFDSPTGSLRCDSGQAAAATAGWPEAATYAVLTGTNISTATDSVGYLIHRVEGVRTLATKRVVLSFRENIYSGSNASPTKPFFSQNFGSGGSATVNIQAVSDIKVFDKRIITFDIPSTQGKTIGANSFLQFLLPLAGTFGMAVSGFQLEEGSIATPFEERPVGLELVLCQRYYLRKRLLWRWDQALSAAVTVAFLDLFPVTMRVVPVASIISQNNLVFTNLFRDTIDVNGGYWSAEPAQAGPVGRRIDSVVDYSAEL